jgi:hypothetical protein
VKKPPVTVHTLALLPLQDVFRDWLNYRKRGIGPEHVGDLIRIATDPAQFEDEWDSKAMLAASHAMRALAQMKAKEAVGPLIQFIGRCYDEDCSSVADELRAVLGRFGPEALPELEAHLANGSEDTGPRGVVADAIAELGDYDPSQRDACIAILNRQLERTFEKEHDREMTSILVDCLLALEATETSALIQRIYESGQIDEEIAGDWEEAQVALGLREDDEEDYEEDYEDDVEEDDDWDGSPGPAWGDESDPGRHEPTSPSWSDPGAYRGKTPKERAQERAKARKKQKKKKK